MSTILPEALHGKIFLHVYQLASTPVEEELATLVFGKRELVGRITSSERTVLVLRSVCTRWRASAEKTPGLWTHASCPLGDGPQEDAMSMAHFSRSLTLSGTELLHARITLSNSYAVYGGEGISQPMHLLMPHIHRVQRLLITIQHTPDPALTLAEGVDDKPKESNLSHGQRALWHTDPMRLLARDRVFAGLPLMSLTVLALYDVAFDRLSELHMLLRHCGNVENLTLLGNPDDMQLDPADNMRFNLPSVQTLTIDDAHLAILTLIGLQTSKLSVLQVCKLDHQKPSGNIDWSFARPAEKLQLIRGWTDKEVIHLLHDLPNLQHLTLMHCEAGTHFAYMFAQWHFRLPNTTGFYAPKLERLTIIKGSLDDNDVRYILRERSNDRNPTLPDLEVLLLDCANVSRKTIEEMEELGRGSDDISKFGSF